MASYVPANGKSLLVGPVYHSAQWAFTFMPMINGSSVVMRHKFDGAETVELIDGRKRFKGTLAGTNGSEIMINVDEGTIGLEFEWLAEAKLILTDELIKEMLKQRKINQNFDEKKFDTIETERLEEIE